MTPTPPAAAGSTAPCRCGFTRSQRDASLGSKHLWPRAAAAATAPRRASRMSPATGTLGPPSRALREPGSETRPFFPCSEETLLFPVPRGRGSSWPSSRPRVPFPPNPMPPLQPALPPLCPHPPNSRRRGGTGYSGSVPRGSGWPLCPLLRALLLPAAASRTTSALGRAAGRPRAGRSRSLCSSCSRRSRDPPGSFTQTADQALSIASNVFMFPLPPKCVFKGYLALK